MIDEAQHISADSPDSHPGSLSSIHQGLVQLPLIFCAFGLRGTTAALKGVGVSRLTRKHRIGLLGLQDKHVGMAVQRAFRQYDVRNAEPRARAIVKRSCGWPQHLAVYLGAALEEATPHIKARGFADASKLGLKAILSEGDEMRKSYYGDRLESLAANDPRFREYAGGLAKQLQQAERPLSASEIMRHTVDGHGASETAAKAFLESARNCGLVATDQDLGYFSPIPSFLTHLAGADSSTEAAQAERRWAKPVGQG